MLAGWQIVVSGSGKQVPRWQIQSLQGSATNLTALVGWQMVVSTPGNQASRRQLQSFRQGIATVLAANAEAGI
jgi:hypothetical protein